MRPGVGLLLTVALAASSGQARGRGLHDAWDSVLTAHVDGGGRVDYRGIRQRPEKLNAYLAAVAEADVPGMSRDEQLAFWINAYNAFTVRLILDHYPVRSIRDIRNPWTQEIWEAGARTLSLDQIEHEILRGQLREPRIHFAIVCASIGCPDLWNRAFTGEAVQTQLDAAAARFMRSEKHVRVARERRWFGGEKPVLYLSRIFKWFGDDFTDGGKRSPVAFIRNYTDAETAAFIEAAGDNLDIGYLDYDWSLNEQD